MPWSATPQPSEEAGVDQGFDAENRPHLQIAAQPVRRHAADIAGLIEHGADAGAAMSLPRIRDLLERKGDPLQLEALTGELHYADIADLLERLDHEDRRLLVEAIRHNFNPDVLPELAAEVRDEVMDALGFEDLAYALRELDYDDVIQQLLHQVAWLIGNG